jgi:phosphatidate cytidylyltransferase
LNARLRTALIALPVFLGSLFYLPQIWWALFLAAWLLIGAWEWAGLSTWTSPARITYLLLVALLCTALWLLVVVPEQAVAAGVVHGVAMIFWLLLAPLWLARGWRVSWPLFHAFVGVVVLLPLWLALVQLQGRPWLLLMLMAILWISDTAAFLCGKRWGRHKLAPAISPGKTWEGVAGALAGVTLYYAIISVSATGLPGILQGAAGLAVFIALAVLGIEGDLFESWVKRTAGVKDSGWILPGHGGILDRIDALTPSLPAAALLLMWFA